MDFNLYARGHDLIPLKDLQQPPPTPFKARNLTEGMDKGSIRGEEAFNRLLLQRWHRLREQSNDRWDFEHYQGIA